MGINVAVPVADCKVLFETNDDFALSNNSEKQGGFPSHVP
jgi:hypothetical protein